MDLIYEGITTLVSRDTVNSVGRQNGPDLRRDYDALILTFGNATFIVRKDLIYEGITTNDNSFFGWTALPRQKGPDLRRDYDAIHVHVQCYIYCQKGPDLRRDYDFSGIVIDTACY